MQLSSIIAIYILFFAASAFVLLPFGVKTDEEVGAARIAGQADSAPHRFDLKRHLLKAALLGAVLFAIYYANWSFGWITPDDLDFYHAR
jgi:predicted secreted protein